MENLPLPNETKIINNGTKKVVVSMTYNSNIHNTYDYFVKITGDGNYKDDSESLPFKFKMFHDIACEKPAESAKQYFDEQVKHYEQILNVEAQPDLFTKMLSNIKGLKERFITPVKSTRKNDI